MKRNVVAVAVMLLSLAVTASAQYTDWSAPVNLGPVVNSLVGFHSCVTASKDGVSLFYMAWDPSRDGWQDLYVSKRSSVNDPWGPPQLLPNVNTIYAESCPALSPDEHRLYFASDRPDGYGSLDLYVSRRQDRRDDFGWEPPVNLGPVVNSLFVDGTPELFEDKTGTVLMYFNSDRPGGLGCWDTYASRMRHDDTFGPPELVSELNSPFCDFGPAVRRDGLEVIFSSDRPGGLGYFDLWTSTRKSTKDPWSAPVHLAVLSSPDYEGGKMCFSFDGLQIYFASNRPGGYSSYGTDLWVATREKMGGKR